MKWTAEHISTMGVSGHAFRNHDDVIKWKHFRRYWPFVRGIHRSPVNSPPKGQWRGVMMFSLICALINGWMNNREAGDLRRHCAHYDATVLVGNVTLVATILVSCHEIKSLHLNWRSGTRRFHLRVPDVQMSCIPLTWIRVNTLLHKQCLNNISMA